MKSLKHFILIVFVLSQYNCHAEGNKGALNHELGTMDNDSILNGKPISFYINHKKIPQICKDVFNNIRQPSDENDVLSLLDSVFTSNNETRPFYFLTLTRTLRKADGAYAEAVGMMGKNFVEKKTKAFVDYFEKELMLTTADFNQWARAVAGEIEILAEGPTKQELGKLKAKMTSNCSKCGTKQINRINQFVERVGSYSP